jgi:beta-lactam-binding protein with PASTA domain
MSGAERSDVTIPNVTVESLSMAIRDLESVGLGWEVAVNSDALASVRNNDVVFGQSPPAGQTLPRGTAVRLELRTR